MLRSLRTLRSIPRIKDIALILGKHGFHQVAGSIQAPLRTTFRRLFHAEAHHVIGQPERLRMAFEELGPTFIKFGQLLSTRPDILSPEYIEELGKLQGEIRPEPFDEIRSLLEEQYQADPASLFARIDPVALASASIAQVHRATTPAGEEVVIKVRKRGIERLVSQDMKVLGLLAEFLAGWPGMRLFDPEGVVRLFERSIGRELNFDHERQNILRMRENLQDRSSIYIPKVFPHLSRPGVLTMEYLPGEKLSEFRARPPDPERGRRIATSMAIGMLEQVFEHGLYHADPHPGNFILMPDGRVGLIDFGNVGRLTPEIRDDLLRLLVSLLGRNYRDVARWILKRGRPVEEVDSSSLALELMDALDPHYGLRMEDIQLGGLFKSLFGMILRHGISIPAPYVLVGRTFVILEGLVRLAAPSLELLRAVEPYMTGVLRRRWSVDRVVRDVKSDASELLVALRSYPGNLAEVLARAAEGRLRLEVKVPDLSVLGRRLDHASSRLQLAILVSGTLISSSILLFAQGAGVASLQTVLGATGFAIGLLLALKLVVKR